MGFNQAVAEALDQIASLIELTGGDSFRASANARAARTIASQSRDLRPIADDPARLKEIPGIGVRIADKIGEFAATGHIKELDDLRAEVPPGLMDLLAIPGLGPKTVRVFWKEGGVTDRDSLKRIIDNGSILGLPRMGEKAVEKIKRAMSFAEKASARLHLGLAQPVADRIVDSLRKARGVADATSAGSLRRGRETVGDVDILVSLKPRGDAASVAEAFRTLPGVRHVLASGDTRSSILMAVDPELGRWTLEGKEGDEATATGPTVQVDLRVLPQASYGAALLYFTGSKDFNVAMRRIALDKGYTLNEYGLFPLDDDPTPPQQRGVEPVESATEEAIFGKLGLAWAPPELRETDEGLTLDKTPDLIEVGDVKAELHAHTEASDGVLTIVELAREAKARGFHTLAVTDHSKSSAVANGLSVERLLEHVDAIHAARAKVKGIRILAGSEVDILADGDLDYDDKTLAKLDLVVASPHTALSQDPDAATRRLLKAIRHPRVHILGHPTGRLIGRRPGLSPDMGRLVASAAEHGVAMEINAHWLRLDLRDTHVREALDAGCLIAINCDVHSPDDFDNLRFGVTTGRRGGLTRARCVNTWSAKKLGEWLGTRGGG
ncbi:MAG: PHP domain-containing protein [Phycisphaerae bacterium]|nr:PHP domain-containing protein [Phycisphaerae bacterium]